MEEWRDVVGYEGLYQVSSEGRVRRIKVELKTVCGRHATPRCNLSRNGVTENFKVDYLVASAFIGPLPEKCKLRQLDRSGKNPRWENLIYAEPIPEDEAI